MVRGPNTKIVLFFLDISFGVTIDVAGRKDDRYSTTQGMRRRRRLVLTSPVKSATVGGAYIAV